MNDVDNVLWTGPILGEWTDYNGHLRDAFYLLIFSLAGDAFLDRIGLDAQRREATGHSMFTLECHLSYLHELKEGQSVEVRYQLLGVDRKRAHLYFSLHKVGDLTVAAAAEQLWLNVNMASPKSAEFDKAVQTRIQAIAAQHAPLEKPAYAGRKIALPH